MTTNPTPNSRISNSIASSIEMPRRNKILIGLFLLSVLLRLMLSADRDILATNSPYDEYWYIDSASRWIYRGGYSRMAFAQLPLYAMWLKLVSLVGVPARLAIDLAWIAGCAYLGMAITHLCKKNWPGVMVYLFLCFHPYSIVQFDRGLSETLLTVMMVFTLAGFLEIWNLRNVESTDNWRRRLIIVGTSLSFAVAYHLRKEGAVMLPPIMMLCTCALFNWKTWWTQGRHKLAYPLIVYPLVATMTVGFALAGANYLRWGIFARYELAAPGYVRVIADLNAIDPGGPTPRRVTVTAATRAKAYAVSPSFTELKPFFEGQPGQWLAEYTAHDSGARGEIANGWFYWAVRDATGIAGWQTSAKNVEQKYNQMADELEKAFADGRLQKRSVPVSFLDPDWHKWLPDVPKAFLGANRIALGLDPNTSLRDLNVAENALPYEFDEFVAIAGRRRAPVRANISGWLIVPEGSSVSFGDGEQAFAWKPVDGVLRSDVPNARAFNLIADQYVYPTQLQVKTPAGNIVHIALDDLKVNAIKTVAGTSPVVVGVEQLAYLPYAPKANQLLPGIGRVWSILGRFMLAAGTVAMLIWLRHRKPDPVMLIITCVLVTVLARTGLLSLLDASSWNGLQTRYIFPIVPYVATWGILGLWVVISRLQAIGKVKHAN